MPMVSRSRSLPSRNQHLQGNVITPALKDGACNSSGSNVERGAMEDVPPPFQERSGAERLLTITPNFKLVFLAVLCLTIISLIASIALAIAYDPQPSDEMKRLIDTCSTTWKMGF